MDGYDKYHTSFTSDGAGYNRTEVRTCDGACYKWTDRLAPGRFAPGLKSYQSFLRTLTMLRLDQTYSFQPRMVYTKSLCRAGNRLQSRPRKTS